MPKERAPISTRLRNRDKSGARIPPAQVSLKGITKKNEHSCTQFFLNFMFLQI
jgi:hypothetical protein